MIKCLVTGSSGYGHKGFIGGHMFQHIQKQKGYFAFENDGDLRNYEVALRNTKDMDWVFHFAADMGGVGYFTKENYEPPINNLVMDLNILRACKENGVKRVFYPSSACIYPMYAMQAGLDLSEDLVDDPAEPDQMYGWEKMTITKLARHSPLDIRVGILHTVYGEGQEHEGKRAKFPPQITYKAIKAQKTGEIEVWGDGKQTRTFLYIDDAIGKIWQIMVNDGYWGEVNVGSDREVTIDEVVSICNNILQSTPKVVHDPSKPVGPRRRRCDNTKFNQHYEAQEETTLEEGFSKIINYQQTHFPYGK